MLYKRPLPNKNNIFFFAVTFALALVIVVNLVGLQIVQGGTYYFSSKNSYSAYKVDRAQRGLIYDRNGIQLVDNVPRFKIFLQRQNEPDNELLISFESLSKLFNKNIAEVYTSEIERVRDYPNIIDIKVAGNLEYNPYIFEIEANPNKYPLVKVEKYMQRKYLYPELTSHILGYTGEVNAEDFETGKFDYGDETGKFGIEKGYDSILRGQNGLIRKDSYGSEDKNVTSVVRPMIKGRDIYLTIDIEYQKKIYDLIEKTKTNRQFIDTKSFAVVAQDVNNGQILAMASYPNFDSNLFVGGISDQNYQAYLNNPGKPLTNKATQYALPPGSTFKLVTDMAALQNRAITKSTIYPTGGTFEFGGVTFADAGKTNHGSINMINALCVSSNIYHMKAALALNDTTKGQASEKMNEVFQGIKLDQISGLNIGSEAVGYFPTPEDKRANGEDWYTGFLLNSSIGQGDVKLTTLAEAKMVSTVASKGKVTQQSIVLDNSKQPDTTQLGLNQSVYKDIDEGMRCATQLNNTYLGMSKIPMPEISLKTGSAETGQFKNGQPTYHGWEISYSPSSNPKVAVAVFMEDSGNGWKGGYISRDFYKFLQDNGKL